MINSKFIVHLMGGAKVVDVFQSRMRICPARGHLSGTRAPGRNLTEGFTTV